MDKLREYIDKKWIDPVWSKVIAALIIAILGSIYLFISSLFKQIPFTLFWTQTISYLQSEYITVNLLTIVIILLIFLVTIIPMLRLQIVRFQLKHLKVPIGLRSNDFDITTFMSGEWICSYTKIEDGWKGQESLVISEGNKYIIRNKVVFILTDFVVDAKKKKIQWTKTTLNRTKHSRETLEIKNNNELFGKDDVGYIITYLRTKDVR